MWYATTALVQGVTPMRCQRLLTMGYDRGRSLERRRWRDGRREGGGGGSELSWASTGCDNACTLRSLCTLRSDTTCNPVLPVVVLLSRGVPVRQADGALVRYHVHRLKVVEHGGHVLRREGVRRECNEQARLSLDGQGAGGRVGGWAG